MNAMIFSESGSRFRTNANLLILLVILGFPGQSEADIYAEVAYEAGGKTLGRTSSEDLNAGGGFKLAAGFKQIVGGFDDVGLLFSIGFLFDDINASNGDAEINVTVLDFTYFRDVGPHRIGVGGSYHMNPRYKDDIDGFARTKINFDDALGLVVRYGYLFAESAEAGIRYTVLDYEADGESIDAGGFGFFFSGSF